MKGINGHLRLSPTDLGNFVACRHLTAQDLALAQGTIPSPASDRWFSAALQRRGEQHERAYVTYLAAVHGRLTDLSACRFDDEGFRATRAAMARGDRVILQAPLGDELWTGRADVLVRGEDPSRLGGWSYEPLDTKLARDTRGSALLQLCAYSEMLAAIQGRHPDRIHVVAPGTPFREQHFRTDDYAAYYRFVKRRVGESVADTEASTYPEPVAHCEICRWETECRRRWRKDDHLSLVAGIRRLQVDELKEWGVTTLASLGALAPPWPARPRRASAESIRKVQGQARIQLQGRIDQRRVYERLPLVEGEGLFRLPPPSPGDVFFDIEGDPFVGETGLEFLFGYAYDDDGEWRYEGRWAMNATEERQQFDAFMAFLMERLARWPDLHVYHYAAYEATALRRLMGRHAMREDDVDRVLRGRVLVDLHTVVKQSVRASVERYSIKDLEVFFGFARAVPLGDVGPHMRALQLLFEVGDASALTSETRTIVEGYNRDDCLSARGLRDWLEAVREQWIGEGHDVARPAAPASMEANEALGAKDAAVQVLRTRLTEGVPVDVVERTPQQHARWLLASLLDFHRREERVVWWEFHRLAELPAEDVSDEPSAIGGMEFVERVGGTKACPVDRYRFPPQEVTRPSGEVYVSADVKSGRLGTIDAADLDVRTIDIRKTQQSAALHPSRVFFIRIVRATPLPDALFELGEWVASHGIDAPGPALAVRRLLLNQSPTLAGGAPWTLDGEGAVACAMRLAVALDASVLAVQGPPGAGKTYTAARMAVALIHAGKRVGVTGPSHKVIRNLLDAIVAAARESGGAGAGIRCMQKSSDDDPGDATDAITIAKRYDQILEALASGDAQVAAGTPWMWARADFREAVDVLIMDEAAQMSLANTIAAGMGARSLILLGDPQQLEQPLKGTHPPGVEVSARACARCSSDHSCRSWSVSRRDVPIGTGCLRIHVGVVLRRPSALAA